MRTSVVPDALEMALAPRKPRGVIHRLDQPCQYPSIALGLRCREAGVRPSIDSVGDSDRTVLTDYTMRSRTAAARWASYPCCAPVARALRAPAVQGISRRENQHIASCHLRGAATRNSPRNRVNSSAAEPAVMIDSARSITGQPTCHHIDCAQQNTAKTYGV